MPESSIVKHLAPDRQRFGARDAAWVPPVAVTIGAICGRLLGVIRSCRWQSAAEVGELGGVAEAFVGGFEVAGGGEGLDPAFGVVQEHGRAGPGEAGGEEDALLAAGVDVAVAFGRVDEELNLGESDGLNDQSNSSLGVPRAVVLRFESVDDLAGCPLAAIIRGRTAAAPCLRVVHHHGTARSPCNAG